MSTQLPQPEQFELKRYPETSDKSLKAWRSADEILINHLQKILRSSSSILIINDQFGALSTCLNQYSPTYWSDSYLSLKAIKINLTKNFKDAVKATHLKNNAHHKPFDFVIIRIPKHNSLLKFQLEYIKPLIHPKTTIISSGMTKDIHKSNLKIFEETLGPTRTSLAVKKARMIFTQPIQTIAQKAEIKHYDIPSENITIYGLAGVFSRDKLDIGTQVLLNYLPELAANSHLIDLGCGNGVLGAVLAKKNPKSQIILTDESEQAIKSAKLTFIKNKLNNGTFFQTDILENITSTQISHIICNPPFHQQNVQTTAIAHRMFKESAKILNMTGELRIVANRHLKYSSILKRYFLRVESVSKDSKFTVWVATNPKK